MAVPMRRRARERVGQTWLNLRQWIATVFGHKCGWPPRPAMGLAARVLKTVLVFSSE